MSISVPLQLLVSTFWNHSSHISVGYLHKHEASPAYHILRGHELTRRTWGLWHRRNGEKALKMHTRAVVVGGVLPVDPWAPNVDSQSIASLLFAASLFPYLGFLYHITKSQSAPKLTLFGFYFLLAFVGATIPAGIYAKIHYGTSLSNVDWLHGSAESLLTLTNLFIVLGLRASLHEEGSEHKSLVIKKENDIEVLEQEKTSI